MSMRFRRTASQRSRRHRDENMHAALSDIFAGNAQVNWQITSPEAHQL